MCNICRRRRSRWADSTGSEKRRIVVRMGRSCRHSRQHARRHLLVWMLYTTAASTTMRCPHFVVGWKLHFPGRQRDDSDKKHQVPSACHVVVEGRCIEAMTTSDESSANVLPMDSTDESVRDDDQGRLCAEGEVECDKPHPRSVPFTVTLKDLQTIPIVVEFTQLVQWCIEPFHQIVFYKPPVGIVTMFAILRLVLSGRIFHVYSSSRTHDDDPDVITAHQVEDTIWFLRQRSGHHQRGWLMPLRSTGPLQHHRQKWNNRRRGRALILDTDDALYATAGGVESVRRRLCLSAMEGFLRQIPNASPSYEDQVSFWRCTSNALQVTLQPGDSWVNLVHAMIQPIGQMELSLLTSSDSAGNAKPQYKASVSSRGGAVPDGGPSSWLENNVDIPLEHHDQLRSVAATTAWVRFTDAVLRLCRDRLLETAYRLARTVEHWEKRLQYIRTVNSMFPVHLGQQIERHQVCLSLAKAAYQAEVARLGSITSVLLGRPSELPETVLISSIKATEDRASNRTGSFPDGFKTDHGNAGTRSWRDRWTFAVFNRTMSYLNRYSIRWKADSKGFLSIRKFTEEDGHIDCFCATRALLQSSIAASSSRGLDSKSNAEWVAEARSWARTAHKALYRVVLESLQSCTTGSFPSGVSEEELTADEMFWCYDNQVPTLPNIEKQWLCMVRHIDSLPTWRRVGEGEKIRLRDVFGVFDRISLLDVFGIPSTMLVIYLAGILHERLSSLPWSKIWQETTTIALKLKEIFEQRVWVPFKGIYDDIMNKSPTLMSALGLDAEEMSLDHMLRDLNFGDGTPATRQEALRKATDQYERDLSNGLFANFARGRLVRLLLIQVQQLKVGMLSALDTIDLLLQGNRIHFKVLAAIPPVLLVTWGTRYFLRVLYNIRAKDLRPVGVVHGEMALYLNKLEQILLLSDPQAVVESSRSGGSGDAETTSLTRLTPQEIGEWILNTHRYLILLDFCCPPFPVWHCHQIHQSLQQFTGSRGTLNRMSYDRQLQLIGRIKQEHQVLTKYL